MQTIEVMFMNLFFFNSSAHFSRDGNKNSYWGCELDADSTHSNSSIFINNKSYFTCVHDLIFYTSRAHLSRDGHKIWG
jgi:hypothetical protein